MFSERLRALRKGRHLSLPKLAQELNKMQAASGNPADERPNTGPQIGSWERGVNTPSYIEVRKLAEFFGVSLDYLAGRSLPEIDINDIFASNAAVLFDGHQLSPADRNEVYALVKGYLRGKYGQEDTGGQNMADDSGEVTLPLD